MTLLITLDWIPWVLLFWTLWLHGGEEWDGGVACDGRALQVVHLAWSPWMVQFGTWWPDGGLIGDGPAYHIRLDSSGPAVLDAVITWRWGVGWLRSWR